MVHDQSAVFKGGDAVGTGSSQYLGPEPYGLLYPEVREPLLFYCFHPDPASAHAAAHAVLTGFGQVKELEAGYLLKDAPGFIIDAVVAAQVAGVMVGDLLPVLLGNGKPPLVEELEQVLGDVDHLEVHHELGILVLEGMVAMGGLNKYLLYPVIDKGLDVLFRQLLEQFFIARLPDALPAAVLLGAEDAEIDACLIEYPGGRLGYLFEPRVIAAIAVGEIEDLHAYDSYHSVFYKVLLNINLNHTFLLNISYTHSNIIGVLKSIKKPQDFRSWGLNLKV